MRFAAPHLLWLLLVVPPAMAAFFWWAGRQKQALMAQFVHARLLPQLTTGVSVRHRRLHQAALVGASSLLIVALARPQWGFLWEEVSMRGLDIVVALDTSRSMLAQDIAPNRLARAKLAALDLLQQAASDRMGLVVFAGSAFLQCPLTVDEVAFRQSLDAVQVGIIPDGGTAIGPAIEAALTAYKEGDNYRVLVLFSDGEDHDSGALEAARKAADEGMKIYTIGLGSTEGELLRMTDGQGNTDYVRDEQGNVIKSRLNEDLLRQVAGATAGGFYLPLRGANTIEALYQQGLSKLPRTDREEKLVKRYYERFHWPLGLALVLLFLDWLYPEGPRERRRSGEHPQGKAELRAGRRATTTAGQTATLLIVFFVMCQASFGASPGRALREYHEGNYDQALRDYEQLLRKRQDDPRLHFNAGASAYREGKFDEAARHFSGAMNSPDLDLQKSAYYNRGNSYFYLGDDLPDPEKKKETWKKSLQDFQSALKLDPKDPDAAHNRDVVQRRLQDLQQQQKQDKQDKQEGSDEENQNQQQSQQQQSQQEQQQQQSQQEQQQRQEQNQERQEQGQDQQQRQPDPQQQQAQQPEQREGDRKQQEAEQPSAGQKDEQGTSAEEQSGTPGLMTPEQARRLLDTAKNDEKLLPINPTNRPAGARRNLRDW